MNLQLNVTIDAISDYMELNVPEDFKKNFHGEAKTNAVKQIRTAIENALSEAGIIGSVVSASVDDHILDERESMMMIEYWNAKDNLDDKRRKWLSESEDAFGITHAEWSIYDAFDDGASSFNWMRPVHDFSDEPTVFISSNSWGKEYTSGVYVNPTMKDLFIEADRSITGTGDQHHIYLETFKGTRNDDGLVEIQLWFGS